MGLRVESFIVNLNEDSFCTAHKTVQLGSLTGNNLYNVDIYSVYSQSSISKCAPLHTKYVFNRRKKKKQSKTNMTHTLWTEKQVED